MSRSQPRWTQSFLDFTACVDPDWVDDLWDYCLDKSFHDLLWTCWRVPRVLNHISNKEEAEMIEMRLSRCNRIISKGLKILHQIRQIDQEEGIDKFNFWNRLNDKELEIIWNYPVFRAWIAYVRLFKETTGLDITK